MKTKIIGLTTIILGLFLFVGVASASDTDILQPASTITYNEDLTVNGTGRFDSIYIGKQDVGGVTFFNGTIVNATTGDGGNDNPVTFGDGVRIDGLVWGGPSKGNVSDQALKIGDTLLPGINNANDLGSSSLKWRDLYLAGALQSKDVQLSGNFQGNNAEFIGTLEVNEVKGLDDSDIPDNITVNNYLPLAGGTIEGNLTINGEIYQNNNSYGTLKAAVLCDCRLGICTTPESWTYDGSNIYCQHGGFAGLSTVNVGFDISNNYINVTENDQQRIFTQVTSITSNTIGLYSFEIPINTPAAGSPLSPPQGFKILCTNILSKFL